MKVLITGGAGYIGSTIASALVDHGLVPVILDNLTTGRADYVRDRLFYRGCISDGALVDQIFAEHPDIYATIHCAGLIVVPESVLQPLRYYRENVAKTVQLVDHLLRNDCRRLVFSSSAACYGAASGEAVDEWSPTAPNSPYAQTKAMAESILSDLAAAGALSAISLRYFNPIGADPQMRTGLQIRNPSHVLGNLIRAWERGERFTITGIEWPTRDGSAIRDYVHIWDLAEAHVAAVREFDAVAGKANRVHQVINLGSGRGTTVRELLAAFEHVTGARLTLREDRPRPGDTAGSFSRNDLAQRLLGWRPKFTTEEGIRHSLEWRAIDGHLNLGAPA
ncbi:UDP-glucose 4-epimerase [Hamadaea flava]|uniref:UDP-glucose 4-epimerase n=1 Tax=Hamadaea flava TaxID=1742688 RepID=A0ABV8LUM7_9ACTN|nr:UDP-glucose 4-epimerase GalE [Hamadaea flava]MCP2327385.1 UDP-glucose 4-epimerase [Hamadaea flava]